MNTQTKHLSTVALCGLMALSFSLAASSAAALKSASYQIEDEFPNYADRVAKTSESFAMNEDGMTWYAQPMTSGDFTLVPNYDPPTVEPPVTPPIDTGSSGGSGGGRRPTTDPVPDPDPVPPAPTDQPPPPTPTEPLHPSAPRVRPRRTPAKITDVAGAGAGDIGIFTGKKIVAGVRAVSGAVFTVRQPQFVQCSAIPTPVCGTSWCQRICWLILALLLLLLLLHIRLLLQVQRIDRLLEQFTATVGEKQKKEKTPQKFSVRSLSRTRAS